MMTIEKTARELRRRIKAAGFREITLTMACNGDKVTVSPSIPIFTRTFTDIARVM